MEPTRLDSGAQVTRAERRLRRLEANAARTRRHATVLFVLSMVVTAAILIASWTRSFSSGFGQDPGSSFKVKFVNFLQDATLGISFALLVLAASFYLVNLAERQHVEVDALRDAGEPVGKADALTVALDNRTSRDTKRSRHQPTTDDSIWKPKDGNTVTPPDLTASLSDVEPSPERQG